MKFLPLITLAGASALFGVAVAQPASSLSGTAPVGETVVLSAFEVRSERDAGYRVERSVATTGVAKELISTPLAVSVVTEEFIRDADLRDYNGVLRYLSSIALDSSASQGSITPGFGRAGAEPARTTFRGQAVNDSQRNGLALPLDFSMNNVDRIEVAKGPMAVFIGGSTLGGVVNIVTKRPLFTPRNEVSARYGANDTLSATFDTTGPISSSLAYRVIGTWEDGNGWRDHSAFEGWAINPQILWQPSASFSTRLDLSAAERKGNLVPTSQMSTEAYQRDYDAPRPALLELGRRRTTGASAGQPFTLAEYRQRIGRAFGSWRQDVFDAYGVWTSLGEGEGLTAGDWPTGIQANMYGDQARYDESKFLLESETRLVFNPHFELRAIGHYYTFDIDQNYFNFAHRKFPDGTVPLAFGNSARIMADDYNGKIESVLKGEWLRANHTVVGGFQARQYEVTNVGGAWDASQVASVPGSPNVLGSPNPLVGGNVFAFFDPRFHAVPSIAGAQRYADDVRPAGTMSRNYTQENRTAAYLLYSAETWEDRIVVTGGVRDEKIRNKGQPRDRDDQPTGAPGYSASSGVSYSAGLSVAVLPRIYLYGSTNFGSSAQPGSLVGLSALPGTAGHPLSVVTAAEQAANPIGDLTGTGYDAGVKFELLKSRLTGSLGYYKASRGGLAVLDFERTAADPRNVGTEVDPNPATANPGQRYRVGWSRPIEGNTSEGVELELLWTPTRNFTVLVSASTMFTNELTVSRPATADRNNAAAMNYELLNGRQLDNTPDDMMKGWATYRFAEGPLQGFRVSGGFRHQSSTMPTASAAAWGTVIPGWTVYDAAVGYQWTLQNGLLDAQINVENLTDELYAQVRTYAPPRELSLTLRYTF